MTTSPISAVELGVVSPPDAAPRRGRVTEPLNGDVDAASIHRSDAGTTLVEVLIALVLSGTLVIAVIAAMRVVVETSSFSKQQAGVEAVLGGAVDQLGAVTLIPCPDLSGPNSYEEFAQAGAASVGWPASTTHIDQIKFWDPDTTSWVDTNGVGSDDCDSKVFLSTSKAMQRIRVSVTSPDSSITRTIDIVVTDLRDPED